MTFLKMTRFLPLFPLSCLFLAACSSTPQDDGPAASVTSPEWKNHQQQVEAIQQYQTRGSFAYISPAQRVSARFYWQQQNPDYYRLVLTNPFGNTVMELSVQPRLVQLIDDNGQRYVADDAEALIRELTGMTIPLNHLRQWMLGLPADANEFTLSSAARLKTVTLTQNGQRWQVEYQNYSTQIQPPLPSQLEISQNDERIKLKIDNWTLQ